jgi:hypothetical protein
MIPRVQMFGTWHFFIVSFGPRRKGNKTNKYFPVKISTSFFYDVPSIFLRLLIQVIKYLAPYYLNRK